MTTFRNPDENGYYGEFGGAFVSRNALSKRGRTSTKLYRNYRIWRV